MVEKPQVCKECGKTLAPTDWILCRSCWAKSPLAKIGKGFLAVGGVVALTALMPKNLK